MKIKKGENQEKLDSLSKILLATGTINYLANTMYVVNSQIKIVVHHSPEQKPVFEDGIKEKDDLLKSTVKRLTDIMDDLAECLNSCGAVSPIDSRITAEPFSILIHGNDNVDNP